MARVKFELLYVVEDEIGKNEVEVKIDKDRTVNEVLQEILGKSEKAKSFIFDGHVFKSNIIVLKNGIDINNLQGPETTDCDTDTIRVLSAEAGG